MSATLRRIEAAQIARAMTAAHESTSERRDPSVGDWRARADAAMTRCPDCDALTIHPHHHDIARTA